MSRTAATTTPDFGELVRATAGGAEVLTYGPGTGTSHHAAATATETTSTRTALLLRAGYRVEVHRLLPDAFVLYAFPAQLATRSPR